MREELVRRNYAETTIRTYLMAMEEVRRRAGKRLDHIGPDDIRHYQVALLEEKKLAIGTIALRVSALRFFYLKVLKKTRFERRTALSQKSQVGETAADDSHTRR